MKKLLCMWMVVCGLLLIPGNMKGQSLKDILNSSAVKNAVTSVTGGKAVTFENLQGTWMYVNPALQLEGDNALKNVAGSLAATEAEKKMKEYCAKVGIVEGVFNYVFNSDSTFTSALKRGSLKGTYSVSPEDKTVTLRYTVGNKKLTVSTLTAHVVLSGNELTLLFNADKLLKFLSTVSSISSNTTLKAINKLASEYDGGVCLVFRLAVDDYHRYSYVDDGQIVGHKKIKGIFHTVNPIANDICPIYKMNSREYCLVKNEKLGTVLMMEVGALMVGKIRNYKKERCQVKRGEEKGRFEFGGSTVVLLLEPDKVLPDSDLIRNTLQGAETIVKMGERIGGVI